MNKKELIEKIEALPDNIGFIRPHIDKKIVLGLVRQLKPDKVTIPQVVADVIEGAREESAELEDAFEYVWEVATGELSEWFRKLENRNIFARAWLDGYEVEKEKRYRISMPKARNYKNHAQILCEKDGKIFWCGEWYPFRTKFTRKELEEANFGWVFDCEGIEIEEVE
jgi:phage protein